MNESEVRQVVMMTVQELKQQNMLRDADSIAYKEISKKLEDFFAPYTTRPPELAKIIDQLKNDRYFHILWMFYRDHRSVEEIAESLDVDVRTVTRNKKRLCLAIYYQLNT